MLTKQDSQHEGVNSCETGVLKGATKLMIFNRICEFIIIRIRIELLSNVCTYFRDMEHVGIV